MGSIQAHWIGLAGEALNFVGACILALDILRRSKERKRRESLQYLRDFGLEFSLKTTRYKGVGICSDNFEEILAEQYAAKLGAFGVGIMALGFLCLVAYHWIEIKELTNPSESRIIGLSKRGPPCHRLF
jgi:hypothetical protein